MRWFDEKNKQAYEQAICLYTRGEIELALDRMAREMEAKIGDKNPLFLGILVGALVPLGNLLPRLDFQLEVNYLHLDSFELQSNRPTALKWRAEPTVPLTDRTVVLVDDILDSGLTLAAAANYCREKGASEIYTAVMLDKLVPRKLGGIEKPDFSALLVDDLFIFGYGLDYSGYLRNLPGIYALKDHKIRD